MSVYIILEPMLTLCRATQKALRRRPDLMDFRIRETIWIFVRVKG